MAGPPKVALTPVELTPPWPPLEAWPQQKTQLFGNSEGLPAIRAKSSSQKTLIPIFPKILEHPIVYGRTPNFKWSGAEIKQQQLSILAFNLQGCQVAEQNI